jgi:hypothetical protein
MTDPLNNLPEASPEKVRSGLEPELLVVNDPSSGELHGPRPSPHLDNRRCD